MSPQVAPEGQVRIAVLSFAHYHANFWAEAFNEDARVDLVGIWDDDCGRGQAAAARFGRPFRPDLDDLLARVDAVAICSETAAHAALIRRAARAGRHILCEKPLAATLADIDAIERDVAAAGVTFMQSFPKRLDPISPELKSVVDSGALGRILVARIRHGHSHGMEPEFTSGWWTDPARSGGGTLIDEGVHAADFLGWLFGPPASVQAVISSAACGLAVEDSAVAVFTWPNGLIGEIATGWMMRAARHSIELYGTEGTALLGGVDLASRPSATAPYLTVWTGKTGQWVGSETIPAFVAGRFHHRSAVAFVEVLRGERSLPSGLAEGRAAVQMIVSAYQAARSGRTVAIPLR
jgi:predicted dehydrogenase